LSLALAAEDLAVGVVAAHDVVVAAATADRRWIPVAQVDVRIVALVEAAAADASARGARANAVVVAAAARACRARVG
jgi:hypothetical protein